MSTLIIALGQRPVFKDGLPSNVTTEDICGVQAAIPDTYMQVSSRVKQEDVGKWRISDTTNWNDFDRLLIFNQQLQYFGGTIGPAQKLFFEQLCAFKGDIWYLMSDPLFYNRNEVKVAYERLVKGNLKNPVDHEMLAENLHKGEYQKVLAVHPNLNIVKSLNPTAKEIEFVDQIRKSLLDIRKYPTVSVYDKAHRLYYAGIKRPQRSKTIRALKKHVAELMLDGPIGGTKTVPVPIITDKLAHSVATIILGDAGHVNVGINHRLLQSLKCRSVSFIDASIDTEGYLIQNEELKHFLYCKDMEEVGRKFHRLRDGTLVDHILKLQDKELQRIHDETRDQLLTRINGDITNSDSGSWVHGSGNSS